MAVDRDYCWPIVEFGPHSFGIEKEDMSLVGSIDLIDRRWRVEILWPSDEAITADFADYDSALAFVRGFEVALRRMRS
jgi:hypothetical protein